MYYITDCCRVCLKKEGDLIDIIKTQTKADSLINKLKLCVSEVEWSINNSILMCPGCIDKLNSAYEFKNQCLQSSKVFENYIAELNESLIKNKEAMVTGLSITLNHKDPTKELESKKNDVTFVNVKASQKVPSIVLAPSNTANTFQNVFLNLLPSTTIKLSQPNVSILSPNVTNDIGFVNINNTLHKILPVVTTNNDLKLVKPTEDVNISKILNETNSEELSVEIDPTWCMPEDEPQAECEDNISSDDWGDLSNEMHSEVSTKINNTSPSSDKTNDDFALPTNNFIPIRPKVNSKKNNYLMDDDRVMEFFNVDHFMADRQSARLAVCEDCGKMCDNIKSLHAHIRQVHSGNFPYRCKQCSSTFALQAQFEAHMRKHDVQKPNVFNKDIITLKDLSQQNESILFPTAPCDISNVDSDEGVAPILNSEFTCDVCSKSFANSQALGDHKFKQHQQGKRKYFVKGMKNAKCEICNREFSTQSYLQLHIKLHYRKIGYRFKVFDKERYSSNKQNEEQEDEKCDEPLENKLEEKMEDVRSENDEEEEEQNSLKIKINLKRLKPEESQNLRGNNDEVTPMDVDLTVEEDRDEESNKSVISPPEDVKSPQQNGEDDNSVDGEEVTTGKPKDEGLLQTQRAEVVNGKQQCSFCLKLYRRKHDLKRHLNNIHLKAIEYVCHLCNVPFYEAFQLTRHLRQHNGFVRCGLCLKEYSILRDLKLHISAAHDNSALSQCGTCGQSFQKVRLLREHMHEHDKIIVYKCHLCSKEFKESRDLSRHLVEHSGMYACNICNTTFAAEQELNNHSKCHSDDPANERKYTCEICPSKFKKKRYLMAHIKKTHANKNVVSTRIVVDCKSA